MSSRKPRARYEKSTRGCKTCKIRRVKCDEQNPCMRCTSTGRICDGPAPHVYTFVAQKSPTTPKSVSSSSNSEVLVASKYVATQRRPTGVVRPQLPLYITPSPSSSQRPSEERRAFSFFMHKAAPMLSGMLDMNLWSSLIPQIAHQSEAVWYADLTIGLLSEHPVKGTGRSKSANLSEHQIRALKWNCKALQEQQAITNQPDPTDVLLKCTLTAIIELQKLDHENGFTLIQTAFNLLIPFLTTRAGYYRNAVADVLVKLYMRNACFISTSHLTDPAAKSTTNYEDVRAPLFRLLCATYGLLKETSFTLVQATDSLEILVTQGLRLLSLLGDWRLKLISHCSCISEIDQAILYQYHEVVSLWLKIVCAGDVQNRLRSDELLFEEMVDVAEVIVGQLGSDGSSQRPYACYFREMALLPPLYFVITMSSDSRLRGRALRMMIENTSQKHGEQPYGIVALHDANRRLVRGRSWDIQIFRTSWRDTDTKEVKLEPYAQVVV